MIWGGSRRGPLACFNNLCSVLGPVGLKSHHPVVSALSLPWLQMGRAGALGPTCHPVPHVPSVAELTLLPSHPKHTLSCLSAQHLGLSSSLGQHEPLLWLLHPPGRGAGLEPPKELGMSRWASANDQRCRLGSLRNSALPGLPMPSPLPHSLQRQPFPLHTWPSIVILMDNSDPI